MEAPRSKIEEFAVALITFDIMAVVVAIDKVTAQDKLLMHLVRSLFFMTAIPMAMTSFLLQSQIHVFYVTFLADCMVY